MELTNFYKAEMPNCQELTLDISKLNIFKLPYLEAYKVVSPSGF